MKIETLRLFSDVAKAGSFYRASKSGYMSQQGINKAMAQLEAELGVSLLDRSRDGIRLTSSGSIFLAHAEKMLEEYDDALADLFDLERGKRSADDRITIYTTYYPAQLIAGRGFDPNLLGQIQLVEEPFDKLVSRAARSNGDSIFFIDVYPGANEILQKHEELWVDAVVKTQCGIVCRTDSPFAKEKSYHRSALVDVPIACNAQKEMSMLITRIFSKAPLHDVRIGASSPHMLLEYAQKSPDQVSTFDSLGFYLSTLDPDMPTDGLCFVPLSTDEATCYLGFLLNKNVRSSARIQCAISAHKKFLHSRFPDYYEEYPLA